MTMSPTPVLSMVVALAASVAAQSDEKVLRDVFDRFDTDDDGKISAVEFPGSAEQYRAMDRDRSGQVDFAEYEKSPSAKRLLAARRADSNAPRARIDPDELLLRRLAAVSRFDKNHDGKVTREEWNGDRTQFLELDLDRDGDLDSRDRGIAERGRPDRTEEPELPEYRTYLVRAERLLERIDLNADGVLVRSEIREPEIQKSFRFTDRNGDNRIDLDELRQLVAAVAVQIRDRNRGDERPRPYRIPFSTWDKNDDDRLELAEFVQRRDLFARIDRNRDAFVTEDEIERYQRSVLGATILERFDLNDDGRVTPREFTGSADAFRRADRNGDGTISRADR